ncbi:MAG: FAD-dependent oxidoreductase, partial [Verrucomicrobiales bacterium]|nr:FAD-dependent oxidoreductase [Verrucomicrobiales bacterium]
MKEKRVVVVGGGVIGLCCAYAAVRRGMEVVVLERGERDSDSCSLGNAGMVVPSHVVPLAAPGMVAMGAKMLFQRGGPFYIKPRPSLELLRWGWSFVRSATAGHVKRCAPVLRDLHLLSRAGFIELGEQLGDFGMEERGLFALCKSQVALEEEAETALLARGLGVPAEVLGAAAVKHFEPGVAMDVAGAVYFPKDAQMDPGRFVEALRRGIEEAGGVIRWGGGVASWEVESGNVRAAVL